MLPEDTRTLKPLVESWNLTRSVSEVKTGKPVLLPSGQANRKERC
jgi:hypothetical protein